METIFIQIYLSTKLKMEGDMSTRQPTEISKQDHDLTVFSPYHNKAPISKVLFLHSFLRTRTSIAFNYPCVFH